MATRKLVLSLALAVLVLPTLTLAQHERRATVLMRNGDRVAGVLEGEGQGTIWVRVNLRDQRKLGIGDVALIDLVGGASGLPETELSTARGASHLAVLRDGTSVTGQFVGISDLAQTAAQTHVLTFRTTNGEERRIPLDQVGRIYFGNFPGSTTAPASGMSSGGPLPPGAIRVPGNSTWTATPLTVRKGDQVRFSVTGRVQLSDDAEDVAGSAGSLRQRHAPGSPLPQNFAGALIAKVGNSEPFPIGNQTNAIPMPANGQLYLGINDDEVGDNRGEFIVTLSHTRGGSRRH